MIFSCGVIPNWTLEGAQGALFKLKGGQRSNVFPWKSDCLPKSQCACDISNFSTLFRADRVDGIRIGTRGVKQARVSVSVPRWIMTHLRRFVIAANFSEAGASRVSEPARGDVITPSVARSAIG